MGLQVCAAEGPISAACRAMLPRGCADCCCELYGFDVILDTALKPWLLEVNLSPSLATDAPLDQRLKSRTATSTSVFFGGPFLP